MRDIGKNIKQLRNDAGLTQDQLAEKLFVTRQTVSNYEVGKSRPDIETIMKLAEILDTDVNAILYGPAPRPDRKRDLTRVAILIGIATLLGLLLILLTDFSTDRMNQFFDINLSGWLTMVYLPLYLPFLGWVLMDALGFLLKIKSTAHPAARYIRWGIVTVFTIYGIAVLPWILQLLFEIPMPPLPRVWQMLVFRCSVGIRKFSSIPLLLGVGLWLCGFPKRKTK